MGKPGSGRYTTYVPVKSNKVSLLTKLFKGGLSALYGDKDSNDKAAEAAVATAKSVLDGKGDRDMFGKGVSLQYGEAPNTLDVKWTKAGDPANPYVPDITSPGAGKVEPTDKSANPEISAEDIKPNFDPKNPSVNTTSPAATAPQLGSTSLGDDLEMGKSSVK